MQHMFPGLVADLHTRLVPPHRGFVLAPRTCLQQVAEVRNEPIAVVGVCIVAFQ